MAGGICWGGTTSPLDDSWLAMPVYLQGRRSMTYLGASIGLVVGLVGGCGERGDQRPIRESEAQSVGVATQVDDTQLPYSLAWPETPVSNNECKTTSDSAGRTVRQFRDGRRDEGMIVDGKENGVWKNFDSNGVLRRELEYERGWAIGRCSVWDAHGTLRGQGTFAFDSERGWSTPTGYWTYWNADGSINKYSGVYPR
jgi:hypothetical protein